MTREEFEAIIDEQHKNGLSDEDIFKAFCGMFIDGEAGVDREALEVIAEALGFEITEEAKAMSDEELKANIFEKDPNEAEKGKDPDEAKEDPNGDKPPMARKEEEDLSSSDESSEKDEPKKEEPSSNESGKDELDEEEEASRLFGLNLKKK